MCQDYGSIQVKFATPGVKRNMAVGRKQRFTIMFINDFISCLDPIDLSRVCLKQPETRSTDDKCRVSLEF
jgi:hypothetical protein